MKIVTMLFLAVMFCLVVQANAITVTNFSFEDPDVAPGAYSSGDPTGWTFASPVNWGVEHINDDRFGGNNPLPAPGDADQIAYINIGSSGTGSATSDIVGQLLADTTYSLTIAICERIKPDGSAWDPNPDGAIGLLVGGNAVGTFTAYDASTFTNGTITDVTYSWTAPGVGDPLIGQDIQIQMDFTHDAATGGWQQAQFDNVRLIPEPATMSLLGLGCLALIRRKRA